MDDKDIIDIIKETLKGLTFIPGGGFLMGSSKKDEDSYRDQFPQHKVTLQSFLMSRFLITQEQWIAISRLSKVDIELVSRLSESKGDNLPVVYISWYEALEFCNRLSIFTGLNITLPSEAQWEYACRADTTTNYYWGDTFNSNLGNSIACIPIGSYPPNPWGLYDMHGNVEEWCLDDWHDNYEGAPIDGTPWLRDNSYEDYTSSLKITRGGSSASYKNHCSSVYRGFESRHIGSIALGFRICCSI